MFKGEEKDINFQKGLHLKIQKKKLPSWYANTIIQWHDAQESGMTY